MQLLADIGMGALLWLAVSLAAGLVILALNWRRNRDLARLAATRAKVRALTDDLQNRRDAA